MQVDPRGGGNGLSVAKELELVRAIEATSVERHLSISSIGGIEMSGLNGHSMLVPERAYSKPLGDSQDEDGSEGDAADDGPTLYTIDDLMELQDCCYNTARKTMDRDGFPSFKMNERWYVLEEDLIEYWREQTVQNREEDETPPLDLITQ